MLSLWTDVRRERTEYSPHFTPEATPYCSAPRSTDLHAKHPLPQLIGGFCDKSEFRLRVHGIAGMAKRRTYRVDGLSKLRHPRISRHHPKMKVVRRILIVKIVDVLDTKLLCLLPLNF